MIEQNFDCIFYLRVMTLFPYDRANPSNMYSGVASLSETYLQNLSSNSVLEPAPTSCQELIVKV